eukprot:COSAG03_NODE_131_length_11966_cov_5.210163_3_plen_245_part_00
MSAVEIARAAKQARLERLAPPPIVTHLEEQERGETLREPEPEPMVEEHGHVDDHLGQHARAASAYDEVIELDDEVIEIDDTDPSPAGGVVCPWEIVAPPAPPPCDKTQRGEDGVEAPRLLSRWTGEGALPLPEPQQRTDDNRPVPKQAQLDAKLGEDLRKQVLLDYAEETRLNELGASSNFAGPPVPAHVPALHCQRQYFAVPAQANARRYRFDYDEAFDVEDDELDGNDDRPWMTSNRVCQAH